MSGGLDLPYGFKDARVVLLTQAIIGEFLQGMPILRNELCIKAFMLLSLRAFHYAMLTILR